MIDNLDRAMTAAKQAGESGPLVQGVGLVQTQLLDILKRHGISLRQAQWIRAIGPTGLLDSPVPVAVRLAQLATSNGNVPHTPMPTS